MPSKLLHGQQQKIIHLIIDDKFIDMALRQFDEVAPNKNIPVILGKKRELQFVKRKDVKFYSPEQMSDIFHSHECGAVIFHSLPEEHSCLLNFIPKKIKVFWFGWGYDYYDRLLSKAYPYGLRLPQTKQLIGAHPQGHPPAHQFPLMLRPLEKVIKRLLGNTDNRIQTLARIDYFSPVLDVEYSMARQLNPWFKPHYIPWNYGTAEDDFGGDNIKSDVTRNNILVGNCATPENNHLEVFLLLRQNVDLTNRKIIVPLNYGNEIYREEILAIGQQMFGEQFIPVIEFMPKDEYIALLDSCGFVFMNHLRQQAMGNIFIMMMKGAKLYMNPESTAYKWLVERGAAINSVDTLQNTVANNSNLFTTITFEEHQRNIAITMAHCGKKVQHEKTRQLIEIAIGLDPS